MRKQGESIFYFSLLVAFSLLLPGLSQGQTTQVNGFADCLATYQNGGRVFNQNVTQQNGRVSFGFDEQDLFVNSELHDRISFLGETVVKYDTTSNTNYSVSIERLLIKYNFAGNNNLIIGKNHTPLDYWNDTYHHGRLFFPTIGRPLLFDAIIIPLHTIGICVQGHDLGNIKFGYDFMIGNGLGSKEIVDNDRNKSITAAVHIKPVEGLQISFSYYHDVISKGASIKYSQYTPANPIAWQVNQQLFTGSIAYFGKIFEVLAESTFGINHTDTTGSRQTLASYVYAGYRIKESLLPMCGLITCNISKVKFII